MGGICESVSESEGHLELTDQAEAVLSRLQGRARDVVKVGPPTLNLQLGPQPIFDILKQHSSDSVTSGAVVATGVVNPSTKPVTLKCNSKIADVSPCVTLEDFDFDNLYVDDKDDNVKWTVT